MVSHSAEVLFVRKVDGVTFFEAGDPPPEPQPQVQPPWTRAPRLRFAGIVPVNQVLARTDKGVVALTLIRCFDSGCLFEVQTAIERPATRAEQMDMFAASQRIRPGQALPPQLLRFGVQYPDGRKATTLDRHPHRLDDDLVAPEPPVLVRTDGRGSAEGPWMDFHEPLWLWTLPPAETFELVIEWPVLGLELTRVPIDGAAIVEAARGSRPLIDH